MYDYPGNVRELKNIVEYASNVCQENQILAEHLPAYLTSPISPEQSPAPMSGPMATAPRVFAEKSEENTDRAAMERKFLMDAILKTREEKEESMEWPAVERAMIRDAIVKAQGRRNRAAAVLGWSRSKLYRKMLQYGIET